MSFAAKVTAWCQESEERMLAVRRASIQNLVAEIQGRIPVETGYLRASQVAAIGAVSFATTERPMGWAGSMDGGDALGLVLAQAGPRDTVTIAWTASYAAHVEYGSRGRPGRAFVSLGVQRWPQIVAETAAAAFIRNARGATP